MVSPKEFWVELNSIYEFNKQSKKKSKVFLNSFANAFIINDFSTRKGIILLWSKVKRLRWPNENSLNGKY